MFGGRFRANSTIPSRLQRPSLYTRHTQPTGHGSQAQIQKTWANGLGRLCYAVLEAHDSSANIAKKKKLGSRPSCIWCAILDRMDLLKQGLIRRIGTSETLEIWNMNWLKGSLRPVHLWTAHAPKLVSELTDSMTASWNRQELTKFFTPGLIWR